MRSSAPPPDRTDLLRRLGAVAGAGVAVAVVAALAAPRDALQGDWQRLMYLHVPAAWTAYLCFTVVLAASVAYLRTGRRHWDRCAAAATEVGVAATTLALLTGAVWGQAVWGTWWAWEPRLVTTAALALTYAALLGVRGLGRRPRTGRRVAAWLGIAAFAWVPVVHFSVVWWRSLHQAATILGPPVQAPPIDPRMAVALALGMVATTAVALWVIAWRTTAEDVRQPVPDAGPRARSLA